MVTIGSWTEDRNTTSIPWPLDARGEVAGRLLMQITRVQLSFPSEIPVDRGGSHQIFKAIIIGKQKKKNCCEKVLRPVELASPGSAARVLRQPWRRPEQSQRQLHVLPRLGPLQPEPASGTRGLYRYRPTRLPSR